ncbi:MAG: helix-turn-helix domain-containing protein [Clostridiales bacterium]|nr:helix-turn-helix domain-containing protein [Clostridiales bacterium]
MYYDPILVGKRIRELRIMKGVTQEQLAMKVSLTSDHIGRIEIGRRGCSIDLLIELSSYFDVSLDYLVLGKDRSTPIAKQIVRWLIRALTDLEQIL